MRARLTLLVACVAWPTAATAVPVFTRRYQTSCVTCHVGFPRLNAFGEAFRRNGYRFPGNDEEEVKQEPPSVELGAPAYARVFPKAVWPSKMPAIPPLSIVAHGWAGGDPFDGRKAPAEFTFDRMSAMADLLLAAHLSERFTVFGKLGVGAGPSVQPQHQRLHVSVNDLIPHSTIRVGQFVPELFQASHVVRSCATGCHFSMRLQVGQNSWNYGAQIGVELAGNIKGRVRYVAGVVEGNGNQANSWKDCYARVGFKVGGMDLDGKAAKGGRAGGDNWVDNSVEVGTFGYYGNHTIASTDTSGNAATLYDRVASFGGDIFATFGNLGVYGLGIVERHTRPTYGDRNVWAERYVARVRYVVLPWLIPEATFEYFNTELENDQTYQVTGLVDFVVRANLKVWMEVIARRDVRSTLGFSSARVGLDVGF